MYSVNSLKPNYEQVLGILSSTKTNSSKTSSIPLADFWRPERFRCPEIKALCQELGIKFEDLAPQKADYCFEYPTPAYDDKNPGKTIEYSKPSMTDLMILLNDEKGTRITIEAKYTEYVEDKKYSPLLKDWYEKDKPHKEKILECWINYIKNRGCDHISSAEDLLKECPELPYQFLHRTASACFSCSNPILVYQLFYDEKYRKEMKNFENLLKKCATEWLNLKFPFFIVETEVSPKSLALTEHQLLKDPSDLFIYMKNKEQYEFGNIKVRDGYTLNEL